MNISDSALINGGLSVERPSTLFLYLRSFVERVCASYTSSGVEGSTLFTVLQGEEVTLLIRGVLHTKDHYCQIICQSVIGNGFLPLGRVAERRKSTLFMVLQGEEVTLLMCGVLSAKKNHRPII